ncbi:hypothetical protein ABK040_014275 [Willaertia magna]
MFFNPLLFQSSSLPTSSSNNNNTLNDNNHHHFTGTRVQLDEDEMPTTSNQYNNRSSSNNNTSNNNNNDNHHDDIDDHDDGESYHPRTERPNNYNNNPRTATATSILEYLNREEEIQNQRKRMIRIATYIIGVLLIIANIVLVFVFIGILTNKSTSSSDNNNNNGGTGSDSDGTAAANERRKIITLLITIPNIILFACIVIGCTCICAKRIITLYLSNSSSTRAQSIRNYLLRHGLLRYESEEEDEDYELRTSQQLEALQALRNSGFDMNALRLMLTDRDFNADDYDTLIQLGENQVPTGLNEGTLRTLPCFKIPKVDDASKVGEEGKDSNHTTLVEQHNHEEEHHNDDEDEILLRHDHNNNSVNNNNETAINVRDSEEGTIPFCSETLAKDLLEETCCICLSKYEPGDLVVTLPNCLHRYHRDCIFQALRMKNQCPICKNSI